MAVHTTKHKLGLVAMLSILVLAGLLSFVQNSKAAHAAQTPAIGMPRIFYEHIGSYTYRWVNRVNAYYNVGQGRIDTGTWDVSGLVGSIYVPFGSINVGINIAQSGSNYSYAVDTTTTIAGLWSRELRVGEYPRANIYNLHHESEWGTAVGMGPAHYIYEAESPVNNPWGANDISRTIEGYGGQGDQMYMSVLHMLNIEQSNYHILATDGGVISNSPRAINPHQGRPIPYKILALGATGALMSTGGSILAAACNAKYCGQHSIMWAMLGGILAPIGTLLVIISGVSINGWIIAQRSMVAAAAAGMQAAAQAARDVELGPAFAAANPNIAGDIQQAFPAPTFQV